MFEERVPLGCVLTYVSPLVGVFIASSLVGIYLLVFATDVLFEPPRVCRRLRSSRGRSNGNAEPVCPEVRERALRMILEHEPRHGSRWEAIRSIAEKIGCSAETLRNRVKQAEIDRGRGDGVSTGGLEGERRGRLSGPSGTCRRRSSRRCMPEARKCPA